MSTRNDRFNRRILSHTRNGIITDRNNAFSDHGASIERMLDSLDKSEVLRLEAKHDAQESRDAFERDIIQILNGVWLELIGLRHLVRTLDLICQHGRFRDESINELAGPARHRTRHKLKAAERLYERHRALLEKLYFGQ